MRSKRAITMAVLTLVTAVLCVLFVGMLFLPARTDNPGPAVRRFDPISQMKVGQHAYVEATALRFDANGRGWLDEDANTQIQLGLRADMRVDRLVDGYRVHLYDDELYPVDDKGFVPGYVPVTELEYGGKILPRLPKELGERVTANRKVDDVTYAMRPELRVDARHLSLI